MRNTACPNEFSQGIQRTCKRAPMDRTTNLHTTAADAIPLTAAGSPDDPMMREALRLIEAFLALEDVNARASLITLAESLVSYDWVRKVQRR
jgi:hypothetical protein